MNPKIDSFDIVPDKNLERLTNLCETIVEEMDEHFLELFADEKNSPVIEQKICVEESGYCKDLKDELWLFFIFCNNMQKFAQKLWNHNLFAILLFE